jgi:branched-chain amino acid transport system permease protein
MSRRLLTAYLVGFGLLALSPRFLDPYQLDTLNSAGLYVLLALSLNLILGDAGLFNMGHAAFYAVGAYTTAILSTQHGVPVLWTLPIAGLVAGLFGVLVARPVVHLRGDYLLIVTVGLGEIVRIALVNDVGGVTGGSNGIFGVPRPVLFGTRIRKPDEFLYLIWGFVALTVFLFHRLEQSRFGRALTYLREDPVAAEGSGIDTTRYRLAAFGLGAAWAGMSGTLFATKMNTVSPESFKFWESVLVFLMVILGGSGSIPGVIVGSTLVVVLLEVFRDLGSWRLLVFGLLMVVMMPFRPQGLLPWRSLRFRKGHLVPAAAPAPAASEAAP